MTNPHATTTHISTAVADREATRLAREALSGATPREAALWQIAGLFEKTSVVVDVAWSKFAWSKRTGNAGVVEAYGDIARQAICGLSATGHDPSTSKTDLERLAAGDSLCGWMRQYLSSPPARQTVSRVINRTAGVDTIHAVELDVEESVVRSAQVNAERMFDEIIDRVDGTERIDETTASIVQDAFSAKSKGLRPAGLTHLRAHAICSAYHLPLPDRRLDLPDRDAVIATVEADEAVVRTALRCHDDSAVSAAFASWPKSSIEALVELSPLVSQALALAALTPVPPPQQSHVTALRSAVTARFGAARPVAALVRHFVEMVAETTSSEFDARHVFVVKTADERAADRERFVQGVERLLAGGETRLGTTPEAVEALLTSMLDTIRYGELVAA